MIFIRAVILCILLVVGVFIFSFIFSNEKVYYDEDFYKKLEEGKEGKEDKDNM